jgi:hypothetical protein
MTLTVMTQSSSSIIETNPTDVATEHLNDPPILLPNYSTSNLPTSDNTSYDSYNKEMLVSNSFKPFTIEWYS